MHPFRDKNNSDAKNGIPASLSTVWSELFLFISVLPFTHTPQGVSIKNTAAVRADVLLFNLTGWSI